MVWEVFEQEVDMNSSRFGEGIILFLWFRESLARRLYVYGLGMFGVQSCKPIRWSFKWPTAGFITAGSSSAA